MLIFGIDPGSRATGYGLVEVEGNRCRCLTHGAISPSSNSRTDFAVRLRGIYRELDRLIGTYLPDIVVVEEVFHAVNAKTALKLGQVRGVALLAAAQHGIPVCEYPPLKVKQAVVGYGRAEKHQIQLMVKRLLNMKETPQPHDAADALALALCHAFNRSPDRHTRPRSRNHR